MSAFELHVRSNSTGDFAAAWFDDERGLWKDERLQAAAPLARHWLTPTLRLHRSGKAPAVLFNPGAIAVSMSVRDELAGFSELEFLEVSVVGHGSFFILHVTAAIELPPHTAVRLAPQPSGNIVELLSFPSSFTPPTGFFRVLQPMGSAARRVGALTRAIYAGPLGKRAIERHAGEFLQVLAK